MWSLAGVRLVDCREGGIAPIVPGYNAALRSLALEDEVGPMTVVGKRDVIEK